MYIDRIQQALQTEQLDGWLFYDFRRSNPLAHRVLELPRDTMYSRRWLYYVPAQGTPTAIISSVESHVLGLLPGERLVFRTWQDLHAHLRSILTTGTRVAMEYSPMNAIPYIARVDAGTVELVRSFGVEVVSSANISQRFVAQLNPDQIESHREAGRRLIAAKDQLFAELGNDLHNGVELDEYQVVQRLAALIRQSGLVMPDDPHVAVNANASNPHYAPSATENAPIRRGDLILFDFWAQFPEPGSIIADYTWMAFAGTRDEIPAEQKEVFAIVRNARDAAINFIRARVQAGEPVEGREADDAARAVINNAGYGDYFVHRTGHSIDTLTHGNGANLDNFETQDNRTLLPHTCNSVEPGIYLPTFGVRSEVDMLILENDVEVTGVPMQEEIVPLL